MSPYHSVVFLLVRHPVNRTLPLPAPKETIVNPRRGAVSVSSLYARACRDTRIPYRDLLVSPFGRCRQKTSCARISTTRLSHFKGESLSPFSVSWLIVDRPEWAAFLFLSPPWVQDPESLVCFIWTCLVVLQVLKGSGALHNHSGWENLFWKH